MALTLKRLLEVDRRVARFRVCFLAGQSEFTKVTKESLNNFRSGKCNVMVCTSVVEEGIDVSQCKLVIRFDLPPTVASNIQSKGRARAQQATYVMMFERGNSEHHKKMLKLKAGEEELKQTLENHQNDDEQDPNLKNSEDELLDDDENDILEDDGEDNSEELDNFKMEPDQVLSVPETGAYMSESQALQTVYQYCASLPHDQYTSLTPVNSYKEGYAKVYTEGGIAEVVVRKYKITMPLVCPIVDPIQGPYHPNQKISKRKAAIRVCRELYSFMRMNARIFKMTKSANHRRVLNPCKIS